MNSKVKYGIVGGILAFISVIILFISYSIISSTTPTKQELTKSSVSTSKEVKQGKEWLSPNKDLEDYSDSIEQYKKSINTFISYYGLDTELDYVGMYSTSSYFVAVKSKEGKEYFLLNPNGSVVGYFSNSITNKTLENMKGFKYETDSETGLGGIVSPNFSVSVVSEDLSGSEGESTYVLEDYPINKEFIDNISSYKPFKTVNIELGDTGGKTKYVLYNQLKNYVLVDNTGIMRGMKPSKEWKKEVFRRGGSGTKVEVEGVELWVY